MISILLWKEYREQRAILLVLVALAAGVLVGLPTVFTADFGQGGGREILTVVGVLLVWTYGMVCGGMLLAGEKEAGTQGFLDTLPITRLRMWRGKCLIGLLFVTAHVLTVYALMNVKPLVESGERIPLLYCLVLAGGLGLAWALLFATNARSVLGAVGLAVVVQTLCLPMCIPGFHVLMSVGCALLEIPPPPVFVAVLCTGIVFLALPLFLSARTYSRQDRERTATSIQAKGFLADLRRPYRAALWLTFRQMQRMLWWTLGIGLAAGLFALNDPLILWPVMTLALGALCGVTAFLDEQEGARRFLGDQRIPPGPLWNTKVGMRLALLFAAMLLVVSPSLARLIADLGRQGLANDHPETISGRLFQSQLVGITIPTGVFLFLPALYGFSVSLLCGQLFRKPIVAVFAGVGFSLLLFGVWVPGLIAGGVPSWQVCIVPLLLLLVSRLLMRPWAADRLVSGRIILGLTGMAMLCLVTSWLGIWYRVTSVPEAPDPPELAAFLSRLPDPDHNQTGQMIRATISAIETHYRAWRLETPKRPLFPQEPVVSSGELNFRYQVHEVLQQGWPNRPIKAIELAGWLDRVFDDEVWKPLDALPSMPLGVVEDPRLMDFATPYRSSSQFQDAVFLLLARGLQMQKQGDPSLFVHNLDITLALVRNYENGASILGNRIARSIEGQALLALEHWLRALVGNKDLLKRSGDILARHRAALPNTYRDQELAEYLIASNSLDRPSSWLPDILEMDQSARANASQDRNILTFVWQIPWEHERQKRLLRSFFFAPPDAEPSPRPLYYHLAVPTWGPIKERMELWRLARLVHLEAARLMVALRHFQAVTGKPATSLSQLVPGSIAAIPSDPYDGMPFRYRLSVGEIIAGPAEKGPRANQNVAPGQGILWSVGKDRKDDGGKNKATDEIFIVPREKSK